MGYDIFERKVPCLCGNGKLIGQWQEHDTWVSSNRHVQWRFGCPACTAEYVFFSPTLQTYIVRKSDAEKYQAMSAEYDTARRRVLEVASPRYEQKWVEHVVSLPTKKAMCDAIGDCSYSTFLKRTHTQQLLEDQARSTFKFRLERCLDRLKIEDAEVTELTAAARDAQSAADAFWKNTDKKPVPFE